MRRLLSVLLGLAALAGLAPAATAQTRLAPRPEIPGLDFAPDGVWRVRARRVAEYRRLLLSRGDFGGLNAAVQRGGALPAAAAVTGALNVPVVMFRYTDTDPSKFARDAAQYDAVLFATTPPVGNPYTLRTFYEQMSNGLFSIQGQAIGWIALDNVEATYTGPVGGCSGNPYGTNNCNGIWSGSAFTAMQNGMREALAKADTGAGGVNFAQFDNDGLDNTPNSGDDDGIVDLVLFLHATHDGACLSPSNNHLWSHRSSLSYATNDAKSGGGSIQVRDYLLQSGLGGTSGCDSLSIMAIGTPAHELGHALALPDLYDLSFQTEGAGEWSLMASGNFTTSRSPSRYDGWSLQQMGWLTVQSLTTDSTYRGGPVQTADTVFLVNVQGANPRAEYFLLENRQAVESDTAMIRIHCNRSGNPPGCGGGLLIWHIDGVKACLLTACGNSVNAGTPHGVALLQADGQGHLDRDPLNPSSGSNRGDGGDPYPGTTPNPALSFNTVPSAFKNSDFTPVGFAIDAIQQLVAGGEMAFRLRFGWRLLATANGNGTISSNPSGLPLSAGAFVLRDSVVTLTASPGGGANFGGWSGDTSTANASLQLTMTRNWTVIATFTTPLSVVSGSPLPGGVMGATYSQQLTAQGGTGGYSWQVISGALPNGVTLSTAGLVSGIPAQTGSFTFTARVTSGPEQADGAFSLSVTAPTLVTQAVVDHLLAGAGALTLDQLRYLDLLGNNNSQFDVGDFLAWVQATGAPLSAEQLRLMQALKGGRP